MKTLSKTFKAVIVTAFVAFMATSCNRTPVTDEVNVFVGTGGHGHTFPGATLPFGMMQLGPDTRVKGWDGCGGYHYSDDFLYGFSHTHLSGTGIADYSDILILPMSGNDMEVKTDSTGRYGSSFSHEEEYAVPGYYKVELQDYAVTCEMTTALRSGMHRYIFLNAAESRIYLDLTYRDIVLESGLKQVSDTGALEKVINEVLEENQDAVDKYRNGKTNVLGHLVGMVMRKTQGKANPKLVNEILRKKL